jgi:S1-C subfamily serine protease
VTWETAPERIHDDLIIGARSPFTGVKVSSISPALADELRLDPSTEGVVVLDVSNGSPAQSFGFRKGDIVLTVNNQKIANPRDLERATAQQSRVWRITIRRGGQQMSVVLSG